jgi:hypothetical protein
MSYHVFVGVRFCGFVLFAAVLFVCTVWDECGQRLQLLRGPVCTRRAPRVTPVQQESSACSHV